MKLRTLGAPALVALAILSRPVPAADTPATRAAATPGFHRAEETYSVVELGLPKARGIADAVRGPDGRIWCAVYGTRNDAVDAIGAVDPGTLSRTLYPLPAHASPLHLVVGPDNAIWFTAREAIGRITMDGASTLFPYTVENGDPDGITAGPDGALYFTDDGAHKVARITTGGTITNVADLAEGSGPAGITLGPDGALWFTEREGFRIGRVTTDGVLKEFDLPEAPSRPYAIATGPDGALWAVRNGYGVTPPGPDRLTRITVEGAVTEYPLPDESFPESLLSSGGRLFVALTNGDRVQSFATDGSLVDSFDLAYGSGPSGLVRLENGDVWIAQQGSGRLARVQPRRPSPFEVLDLANVQPFGIALGPDGNMWFTAVKANAIGRVTPGGEVTMFDIPTPACLPFLIAKGPDGAMWFTEFEADRVGRIATDGVVSEYPLGVDAGPSGIAAGPDGRIWFTESKTARVGSIATDGTDLVEYDTPTPESTPADITVGPDGRLWFAESGASAIAAATTSGEITEYSLPLPGPKFGAKPVGVVSAPGGRIWFAGFGNATMGFLTSEGEITDLTTSQLPIRMAVGPDSRVWMDYFAAGKIGHVSEDGTSTDYVFRPNVQSAVAAGPDGAMWFTSYDQTSSTIVRLPLTLMDAEIGLAPDGPFKGEGIYDETGQGETLGQSVAPGGTASFVWRMTNRGRGSTLYTFHASEPPACFSVRTLIGRVDRTAEVLSGTSGTDLPQGTSVNVRVEMTALGCAHSGDEATVSLDVTPSIGVSLDRVQARLRVK